MDTQYCQWIYRAISLRTLLSMYYRTVNECTMLFMDVMSLDVPCWNALPGSVRKSDSIQYFKASLKTHFLNCR